jgi:hypothetical protein
MFNYIIRCRDLRDRGDDEILDALRPEGVTNVKHILSNKNGIKQPTNTSVLTFAKPSAPKFFKAAHFKISPWKCSSQILCGASTARDLVTGETVAVNQLFGPSAVNRATWMQTARKNHIAPTVQAHIRHSSKNARNGVNSGRV